MTAPAGGLFSSGDPQPNAQRAPGNGMEARRSGRPAGTRYLLLLETHTGWHTTPCLTGLSSLAGMPLRTTHGNGTAQRGCNLPPAASPQAAIRMRWPMTASGAAWCSLAGADRAFWTILGSGPEAVGSSGRLPDPPRVMRPRWRTTATEASPCFSAGSGTDSTWTIPGNGTETSGRSARRQDPVGGIFIPWPTTARADASCCTTGPARRVICGIRGRGMVTRGLRFQRRGRRPAIAVHWRSIALAIESCSSAGATLQERSGIHGSCRWPCRWIFRSPP